MVHTNSPFSSASSNTVLPAPIAPLMIFLESGLLNCPRITPANGLAPYRGVNPITASNRVTFSDSCRVICCFSNAVVSALS